MRRLLAMWVTILLLALVNQKLVGQAVTAVVPQPVMPVTLDFSSDGSQFVVGGNFGLWVFDTESGQVVQRITGPKFIRAVAFSPSVKEQFVTWGDDNLIQYWEVGRVGPTRVLRSPSDRYRTLAFSPDGRLLVSNRTIKRGEMYEGEVAVRNATTGEVDKSFQTPGQSVTSVAFSRDGKLLALATTDSNIEVYDRRDWKRKYRATIPVGVPIAIKFLDDQNTIAIAGGEFHGEDARPQRTGKLWLAKLDREEYTTKMLTTRAENIFGPLSCTPDGKRIVVGTSEIRTYFNARGEPREKKLIAQVQVRSIETGDLLWSADGNVGDPYGLAVSPDSSLVAFCSGDSIGLLAADSGRLIRTVTPLK